MDSKNPTLAAIIGWPVSHSLSPLIHTIWAHRAGIEGYYIPVAVPASYVEFKAAIEALKKVGFKGANITIPHKENALRYASSMSEAAKKIGAANMITFKDDGPYADNSDAFGFSSALAEKLGNNARGEALILGAGGAARAIAVALNDLGFSSVAIANRTKEKAETLAKEFGLHAIAWDERNDALANAHVVVNATSLGMKDNPPLKLDAAKIQSGAVVADIVYAPLETELLKAARARGLTVMDGLEMLMRQAVVGFETWFGPTPVADEALKNALIQELRRRNAA